jgi:hypothetical protein
VADEKWRPFNCFLVKGTVGTPTGTNPENRVFIKPLEAQIGQFLVGCKCPVSRGDVVQQHGPLGDLHALGVLPSKCPSIATAKISSTRLLWFGPLEEN